MPLYDYRCANGHTVEALVRAGDSGPERCETCGKKMERLVGAPAKPKVRGGKRRRDIRFRRKGQKIDLTRNGGK